MELWDTLHSAAVLGTERHPFTLPAQEGPLGAILARLQGNDPEHALLGALAVVSLYRRVGQTPASDTLPLPASCPAEEQLPCDDNTAKYLTIMLLGQHEEVLPEWLSLMAHAGRTAPFVYLPALFDIGKKKADLREAITAVAGVRGRWLAEANPDWSYILQAETLDEACWASDNAQMRLGYLKGLRRTDPARVRELLVARWQEETPQSRAVLLAAFEQRLNSEDEPFLETALADRRKEVRKVAADLLARLPGSRLSHEMLARIAPLLAFTPGKPARLIPPAKATKPALEVILPESCDKAMIRDGIEEKVPAYYQQIGVKAWWLIQMLSAVPPSHWCRVWGESPAALIGMVQKHEMKKALLEGWALAAVRQRDEEWAIELLPYAEFPNREIEYSVRWDELAAVPSPASWQAYLLIKLRDDASFPTRRPTTLYEYLDRCPKPWDVQLSKLVYELITSNLHKDMESHKDVRFNPNTRLATLLPLFARHAAPAVLSDGLRFIREELNRLTDDQWKETYADFLGKSLDVMQFRLEMHQA